MSEPQENAGAEAPAKAPSRILELASNVTLGGLLAYFAYASFLAWDHGRGHVQMLILAIQESFMVILAIARRQSRDASKNPKDWALAFIGSAAPLLQRPGITMPALEPVGIGIQLFGTVLATFAVASLGRSYGLVPANRGIQTTGFYRFVRHPLYGSYLVCYFGFLLGSFSLQNLALIFATFACQYLRAVAEERILSRDPEYAAYMQKVTKRFVPFLF